MTSAGSGEDAMVRKKVVRPTQSAGQIGPSSSRLVETSERHGMENSSDESGGEDEIIVKIDSPSTLSFRHAS